MIVCSLQSVPLTNSISKQTVAWFNARVQSDPCRAAGSDPNQRDAEAFAAEKGFKVSYVPKVSPRMLLQKHSGLFLVRLLIHYSHQEATKLDTHFVVYDAVHGHIIDNLRGMGAVVIDDADRVDNRSAIRPFKEKLFPAADDVRIASVCSVE